MRTGSPYQGSPTSAWPAITKEIVARFPLTSEELVAAVQRSWDQLFSSQIGSDGLIIGRDIFLPAQATGVILEKLIALHLAKHHEHWRSGTAKHEKDVVCLTDEDACFEIKTSSSANGIYGNRSTGNRSERRTKERSGFYLIVNYQLPSAFDQTRAVKLIRFGWIDDDDWVGQASASGQQASVSKQVAAGKLVTLFPHN